ncbi:hypothetical protein BJ741DRAFT_641874 [Chytriomyces cf. hyalinus JEL632]|nr:hypothetical protein BJ741DRAFT_641874 [Chytriomyces cf. hyalinus JEL632]
MLQSRSHVRKTRKGSVIKVVRELYLREDIGCGVGVCADGVCASGVRTMQALPANANKLHAMPHIIVPDTNMFLHQMDLLEHKAFSDVVVLQTALDEVRHRSTQMYARLRAITADVDKRFYVFSNEFMRDTFVKRVKDESPNDRNDRAIREACRWYAKHLPSGISIVLISDDADNRRKATADGMFAYSVREYVEGLTAFPELVDMIAVNDDADDAAAKKISYPDHLTPSQITAGLKSGAFCQGTLGISFHNFLEGSIYTKVDGEDTSVKIIGRTHLNRGVHGDVVAVRILPKSEWLRQGDNVVLDAEEDDETLEKVDPNSLLDASAAAVPVPEQDDEMQTEETEQRAANSGDWVRTGCIVGIIQRKWRPFCGTIEAPKDVSSDSGSSSQQKFVFFWPMDKRIPKIKIRTRQAKQLAGQRIMVAIDSWGKQSLYPMGHFVKALGNVGDRKTETDVILLEHDVRFMPFSKQVMSYLPDEGEAWVVKEEHLAGRMDFRHLDVCSIDPPGCTDIDDALHARLLPNGNYEVGVHIADVSHFVKPGNAMDQEAATRGTTVYLVDRRIDMLPSLLGTNLCSLRSNVERLSFSCIWEVTPDADIIDVKYSKSVIRSRASLTYDAAQARLDDPTLTDPVSTGIKLLNSIAKKLRAKRMANGALVLASPEVRFSLDNDAQDPLDVELKEMKDTNALVEEFMLLANIYVAKKIYSVFPDSSMLRRHPKPSATNFESLIKAAAEYGIEIDPSNNRTLSDSLDKAVLADEPYFNKLIRIMTTRCMMQAVYFCSGTLAPEDFWHYGLATDIYTHFTSPIRRYADLVVHRLLAACIGYDKTYSSDLVDKVKASELSDVLNFRHRNAQQASRSSVELFTNLFFKNKVIQEEGFVIRVMKNGFSVIIPRFGIEGIVHSQAAGPKGSTDSAQLLTHDAVANTLTCPTTGAQIRIFGKVLVRVSVEEAGQEAAQRSKLVVKLIEPRVPGLSVDPVEVQKVKVDVVPAVVDIPGVGKVKTNVGETNRVTAEMGVVSGDAVEAKAGSAGVKGAGKKKGGKK